MDTTVFVPVKDTTTFYGDGYSSRIPHYGHVVVDVIVVVGGGSCVPVGVAKTVIQAGLSPTSID